MQWSVIKKFWPYIAVAALSLVCWRQTSQVEKYRYQATALESAINGLNQEIKQTKISLNDSIEVYQAEVENLYVTQRNLKVKYNELLTASKLSPKDISSVTEITNVIHCVDTVWAEADTFGGLQAHLQDQFVKIDVEVFFDKKTIINYEVKDSLTVINVQKQHSLLFGLIKWKEHKNTRVINNNPKARVVGLQTIEVLEK